MENKKSNLIIFSIIAIVIAITSASLGWVFSEKTQKLNKNKTSINTEPTAPFQSSTDLENRSVIANPCGLSNFKEPGFDRKDFLCYFFDLADGSKKEIWIKPTNFDTFSMDPDNSFEDFIDTNKFKKYIAPDKSFTFNYPKNWSINNLNWENNSEIDILTHKNDASISLQFFKIEDIATSIEDEIMYLGKNYTVSVDHTMYIDGIQSDRIETRGAIYLFIPKDSYHLKVIVPKTHSPLLDFPIEYLLTTISFN